MKFGRRLQEEAYGPYQPHYIAYKELKNAIKLITGSDTSNYTISEVTSNFGNIGALSGSPSRPPEARFQDLLNFEVEKVNNFATLVYSSTSASLQSILKQLPTTTTLDAVDKLNQEAELSSDGVSYLHAYVQLNLLGFRKITKKYDKHSHGTASSWYLARLAKEPFVNLNFDYLIELISVCFTEIRRCRSALRQLSSPSDCLNDDVVEEESNLTAATTAEVTPELTNTTYLVAEDNIMQVRIHLAKHIPLVSLGLVNCGRHNGSLIKEMVQGIPPRHQQLQESATSGAPTDVATTSLAVEEQSGKFTNPSIYKYEQHRVSHGCLYFDHPTTLEGYRNLLSLSRSTTTQPVLEDCLRLRWPAHQDKEESIVLELTRPDGPAVSPNEWFDESLSNTERKIPNSVALSQHDVERLLDGSFNIVNWTQQKSLSAERLAEVTTILTKATQLIRDQGYAPMWYTWCHRTSYRKAGRGEKRPVYAYLDEGVRFLEWDPQVPFGHQIHESCLMKSQRATCPFGVLSISVPASLKPGFLPTLTGLTTVSEVWMYSRYLHGTSVLLRSQLELRELPHWYKFITRPMLEDAERPTESKLHVQTDTSGDPMRVDVMSMRPRERIMHEHAVAAQQEEQLDVVEELATDAGILYRTPACPATTDDARHITSGAYQTLTDLQEPLLSTGAVTENLSPHAARSNARTLALGQTNASLEPSARLFGLPYVSLRQWLPSWTFFQFPDWLRVTARPTLPSPGENVGKVTNASVRVEPKTFFANERTLLQWMNTAVLLSTISITLLNFGTPTGRLAGLILAPVALFFIIYSFLVGSLAEKNYFCSGLFATKLLLGTKRTDKL